MRRCFASLAMAVGLALTGCAQMGGTFLVEPFLQEEIEGETFNHALARDYQQRTEVVRRENKDWFYASRLAKKGYDALDGKTVLPWRPDDWQMARDDAEQLEQARETLMAALAQGRDRFPQACATAQVRYDAWLEHARIKEPHETALTLFTQAELAEAEKTGFESILPACQGVIDPDRFVIFFGWDRYHLTAVAKATVAKAAHVVGRFAVPKVRVESHTDRSGSPAYNMRLAQKRARTVSEALEAKGVSPTTVDLQGEAAPAVPTEDGVREPLNRRAVITLSR